MEKAKIIKGIGGLYTVEMTQSQVLAEGTLLECRAKGSFRKDGITPLPGDNVEIEHIAEGGGFITGICERKNSLIRPASANIDLLVFVVASAKPNPDLFLLDKMTSVVAYNGIDILMLVNKADIADADRICRIYNNSGIMAKAVSAAQPQEYAEVCSFIRQYIKGKTSFFTGASGVGKSSIINMLFPELELQTGALSRKISRGKHTTRSTTLYKIEKDTYIADTPGFSMLEIAAYNMIPKDGLLGAFPDIEKYAFGCRYNDCSHLCEDGCNVMQAIADGKIEKSRHESYKTLYEELKNKNEWDS